MKELHCLVLVSKWDMVLINLKIFIKAALSTTNSQIRTPIFYSEVLVYVRELFKINMLMMQ